MRYAMMALAATMTANGAEAGDIGPTSRASIGISLSVAPHAVTSPLGDRTFDGHRSDSVDDVCLWMNTPTRAYSVAATGSGSSGAFVLGDGAAPRAYAITWSDGEMQSVTLMPGAGSPYLTSTADGTACGSVRRNVHLQVRIDAAPLGAAKNTGTVSFLIAPM